MTSEVIFRLGGLTVTLSRAKSVVLVTLALLTQPMLAFSAASEQAAIVFVADSRALSGWRAWCVNLYNESPLQFALLTVAIIPLVGVILGLLADFVMSKTGINLRSRAMGEH